MATKGNNDHLTQRKGGSPVRQEETKMQAPWPTPHDKGRRSGDNVLPDPISSKK